MRFHATEEVNGPDNLFRDNPLDDCRIRATIRPCNHMFMRWWKKTTDVGEPHTQRRSHTSSMIISTRVRLSVHADEVRRVVTLPGKAPFIHISPIFPSLSVPGGQQPLSKQHAVYPASQLVLFLKVEGSSGSTAHD